MEQPPLTAAEAGQIHLDDQAYNQHSAPSLAQQQQYGANSQNKGSASEGRYLWIGGLLPWMDETYLMTMFRETAEALSARVVRKTEQSKGHGFVEFINHSVAKSVLHTYNGAQMPDCEQTFRLNWAQTLYTIYAGNLAPEVNDSMLMETFKNVYTSVQDAFIVTDKITGRHKGYGFVRFTDENEQLRALSEMNGKYCSTRPMYIDQANTKLTTMQPAMYQNTQGGNHREGDTKTTTISVGTLHASVTYDELKSVFGQFGKIEHVYIVPGKHCGFVRFANRKCAEDALSMLNGTQLGGQNICLRWGHNKKDDQLQWNGGGYYGYPLQPQGSSAPYGGGYYVLYGPYGYAFHPNPYYGGYNGYGNYGHQQQQ